MKSKKDSKTYLESGVDLVKAKILKESIKDIAESSFNQNVISKVIVSDTICQKKNLQNLNKLEIFSISELMSEVITNIIIGGSLSLLFES